MEYNARKVALQSAKAGFFDFFYALGSLWVVFWSKSVYIHL